MAIGKYNTYVGMRYVPIFDGEWDNTKTYEPLTIVSYQGNSYTSKTFVPVGADINNDTYWAVTGNYNAQVEAYRQETRRLAQLVEETVTPEMFGAYADGVHDDTVAFKTAIETGKNVRAKLNGIYKISVVNDDGQGNVPTFALKSGQTIDLNSCTINVVDHTTYSRLFNGVNVENVTIKNGTIIGDRTSSELVNEFHHCVNLWSCKNIRIENLNISNFHGDGICINEYGTTGVECENIYINNCVIDGCYRNGISLIDADHVVIENCYISDTDGTSPMAGIDIEPNRTSQLIDNVYINKCTFEDNTAAGIDFNVENAPTIYNVYVDNCEFIGGNRHIRVRDVIDNTVTGAINIYNCLSRLSTAIAVSIKNHYCDNFYINVTNLTVINPNTSEGTSNINNSTFSLETTGNTNNVYFKDIHIINGASAPATLYMPNCSGYYEGDIPVPSIISGDIVIVSDSYVGITGNMTIPPTNEKIMPNYVLEASTDANPSVTINEIPHGMNIGFKNKHANNNIFVNGNLIPPKTDAVYSGSTGEFTNHAVAHIGYKNVNVASNNSATIDISNIISNDRFVIACVARNANSAMSIISYTGKNDIVTNAKLSISYDTSTHVVTFANTDTVSARGFIWYM